MTAASAEPPFQPARLERSAEPVRTPEGPTWTELADALYLAACQDAAAPYRDLPPARRRAASAAGEKASPQPPPGRHRRPVEEDTAQEPRDAEDEPGPLPPVRGLQAASRLIPARPADARAGGESGWSGVSDLTDPLGLGRSLRPLRLVDESPTELRLDEEATAQRAAADGLWTPVCHPVPERLLDLLLLVDDSPSMALWQRTIRQVQELMEHTAAFRTVRTARWSPDDAAAPTALPADARGGDRQLLLVLTDGGSPAWRTGQAAALLHRLARSSPTAVLSLLPQHLWELTLPTVSRTRLRVPAPAAKNASYEIEWARSPSEALGPWPVPQPVPSPGDGVVTPVPVVELRPPALAHWARLVAAAGGDGRHEVAALLAGPDGDLRRAPADNPVDDAALLAAAVDDRRRPAIRAGRARELVRRFRATASPTAYALARQLAAAPLNLEVMRLVQQSLPRAEFWNLAEIVLLGLLRRTDAATDVESPYRVSFDFPDGVREELLALGTRAETMRVLRQVEQHLGRRFSATWEGGAALVTPDSDAGDPPMTEETRPFVAHLQTALCALSGPYLARANRLGRLLQHSSVVAAGVDQGGRRQPARSAFPAGSPGPGTAGDTPPTPAVAGADAIDYRPPGSRPKNPSHLGRSSPPEPGATGAPTSSPTTAPAAPRHIYQGGSAVSAGLPVAPAKRGPHDPPRIWGNVPQRNRNFTGREALLEQLRDRLGSGVTTAVLPEALHGMGGVGKSQIAIEYVYRHSRDYGLIWWIAAEQENQIVQSLIELGDQMGLRTGPEFSAVPAVLNALRTGEPYRNWLLVFDNAEDPKTVRRYFPSDGPGRILVTSRNAQWSSTASSLEVNVFTREESVAVLRRGRSSLPDDSADQLASALGDLPLAVEQAAVWLAETGMPVQQYLELFERKWAELLQSDPPPDYEMPVAAAWNVSLERLREDRPDALQLLQVCAFFAPEPISWELFSAVRGVSVPQALQGALEDPVNLGRAVREVGRYALARIDHRQSTIQLHRLVQRVLIEQMNPQEQAQMRHAAHQLLSNADPRNPMRAAHWPRYSSLLPHVRASNAVECEDGWSRRLVLNEVAFLFARGAYSTAVSMGERAAALWRERLGDDHVDVLAVDQYTAAAMLEQGEDYERAYNLQTTVVERYRRVLGADHEDTLQAETTMANHHRLRGDFYLASELTQRVYETSERQFGPDDPVTLLAAHNHAVDLRLSGEPEKARKRDLDTWQRRVEVIGEDHLFTLGTYNAYLLDLQEIGRYEESLEGYERLAAQVQEQLGEEHKFTIRVTRNLAVTRRKAGDYDGAYSLTARYVPLLRERFGEESSDTMLMSLHHANDLREVGKLSEARELGVKVMEAHRARYGRRHPHSFATCMNLAVTLRLLGEVEAARELDEEAATGLSETLRPDHPRTLRARMNLASDHFALGRPQQAYEIDQEVEEATTRLRGADHPANLAVRLNLSQDLKALGRSEEARELHETAVQAYRRVLGVNHPTTRDAERGVRANADIDALSL